MKKFTIAAGAAALAMGATALFAQPAPAQRAKLDTDGNGQVTRAEAQAAANAAWTRMDANRDGKLDAADRAARQSARFDRIDADKNGAISRAEFEAMHQNRGMKRAGMAGHEGHKMGPGHKMGGGKGRGGHGLMAMGKMADTNNDGAVSRAEFDAGVAKHFAMVDANNDGTITKDERQAARQKMRAMWQAQRAAPAPAN